MYVLRDGSLGGIRLSSDAGIYAPADLVRCCSQHLRMPAEWGMNPLRPDRLAPKIMAELVGLYVSSSWSAGEVAVDFELTATAMREWVK
jgi:hypothetical protein